MMYHSVMSIIGIDEAGRGPIAGPVAVGVVRAPKDFKFFSVFPDLNDSKKLNAKKREHICSRLKDIPEIFYAVQFSSAKVIDEKGIVRAIQEALAGALKEVVEKEECEIVLDGGLRAPSRFKNQKTIVRGDQTEPAIMLASVVAKVSRDRLMARYARQFPQYAFETHKGYGTPAHYKALKKYGLSSIHRRSFIHIDK